MLYTCVFLSAALFRPRKEKMSRIGLSITCMQLSSERKPNLTLLFFRGCGKLVTKFFYSNFKTFAHETFLFISVTETFLEFAYLNVKKEKLAVSFLNAVLQCF